LLGRQDFPPCHHVLCRSATGLKLQYNCHQIMASLLSHCIRRIRSCPLWGTILVVITVLSIGTRLLVISPRLRHKTNDWDIVPWFLPGNSEVNSHNSNTSPAALRNFSASIQDFKLLFIGNSYTEVNDLAGLTKEIIDHQFSANITIRSHHPGGQTFYGHLESTQADYRPNDPDPYLHELRPWLVTDPLAYNWVILQEQSQIPGFSGVHDGEFQNSTVSCLELDRYVQQIPKAKTIFFMTWGRRNGDDYNKGIYPDYLSMQARLTQGYEHYLDITSTEERSTWVAPVGLVYENIYNDIQTRQGIDPSTSTDSLFYKLYMVTPRLCLQQIDIMLFSALTIFLFRNSRRMAAILVCMAVIWRH
jgi:hypothetical protein